MWWFSMSETTEIHKISGFTCRFQWFLTLKTTTDFMDFGCMSFKAFHQVRSFKHGFLVQNYHPLIGVIKLSQTSSFPSNEDFISLFTLYFSPFLFSFHYIFLRFHSHYFSCIVILVFWKFTARS